MSVNDFVLVQGLSDTRATFEKWARAPWRVLREWVGWSLLIAVTLLLAVTVVARLSTPDLTGVVLPGVNHEATWRDLAFVLYRNSLVLALHAMACVAGFIAGSALPHSAARRTGLSRWIHEKAGPLAIGFVVCATCFSLVTQTYALGSGARTLSSQLGMAPETLLIGLMPHALPELVALFLPLAAWLVASHRGDWHELLAATFATVAIAVPVLVLSSLVEIYLSPQVILALAG